MSTAKFPLLKTEILSRYFGLLPTAICNVVYIRIEFQIDVHDVKHSEKRKIRKGIDR